jgi:hypothetical protein
MRRLLFFILVVVMAINGEFAFATDQPEMKREMKRLLPAEMEGYKSDGKDQFYDRQTTFRYMDGAAELYRSYGFKLLMVRRYVKSNDPPIIVELFDMGSSEDAFGVFSFETAGEDPQVGQGSDYGGGLLRFWKGKYFVNVYAEQEASPTKQDVLQIGKGIAKSIKTEGQKPKLLNFLPRGDLDERSIRYFHHYQGLNYHYFVAHENILNLGARTNAVLASYLSPQSKGKTFLLFIEYSTQQLATKAFQSFVKAFMPESATSGPIRMENGRWVAAQPFQKYVVVLFDAPSRERTEELIQAATKNLKEKRP